MYYLLESNRIIDTNEVLNSGIQIKIKVSGDSKVLYLIGWFGERFFGTIKKQSENVYDLIDKKQDLIKIDGQIIMAKTILGDVRNLSGISAIYKPDAKGDYIKVWEKKENE